MRYVLPAVLLAYAAMVVWGGIYRGMIQKEIRRLSFFRQGELVRGSAAVREGWKYVAFGLAVPTCFILAIVAMVKAFAP